MKTSEEFSVQVREKWGLPVEVGKVALRELFGLDDTGCHRQVMAALHIGHMLGESRYSGPEEFIRLFEEGARFALMNQ